MKESFGKRLEKLRRDANLNQSVLGEKLGFSQRTVSDWEHDVREPNFATLRKIAELFDVTYKDLLDD